MTNSTETLRSGATFVAGPYDSPPSMMVFDGEVYIAHPDHPPAVIVDGKLHHLDGAGEIIEGWGGGNP